MSSEDVSPSGQDSDPEALRREARRIAHDLNNMFTVIVGSIDGAMEEILTARQERMLKRAQEAVRRAEALASELSKHARGKGG
ncbi:histidine kinase dimerization/phospho-acceptor domain-containing protein [Arboricoccus pini]|uniref:histidine kinase dimerization/phospho-acceptor domain-containing protein n=1 Tax=Arboricoccus pini TaxID=1963835 RepID=UPI000B513959|nr:histidine kinase dimerization/phospho-acceptor domain-containing protein [Arboricoccus pini]